MKIKIGSALNNFKKLYANGGPGDKSIPEATMADSLSIYNNAIAIKSAYDKLIDKGLYTQPKITTFSHVENASDYYSPKRLRDESIQTLNGDIQQFLQNGTNDRKYQMNANVYPNYTPAKYQAALNKTLKELLSDKNSYSANYKDLYPSVIDPNVPSAKIDTRIAPQGQIDYREVGDEGRAPGGIITGLAYYDPLAVKPYSMLTEAEKKQRKVKYGTDGFPDSKGSTSTTPSITPPVKTRPDLSLPRMPIKSAELTYNSDIPIQKVPEMRADTMGSERFVPYAGSGYGNPNIPQGYWDKGMGKRETQYAQGGNLPNNKDGDPTRNLKGGPNAYYAKPFEIPSDDVRWTNPDFYGQAVNVDIMNAERKVRNREAYHHNSGLNEFFQEYPTEKEFIRDEVRYIGQEFKNGGKFPPGDADKATFSDSLAVYNNAVELNKFYKNIGHDKVSVPEDFSTNILNDIKESNSVINDHEKQYPFDKFKTDYIDAGYSEAETKEFYNRLQNYKPVNSRFIKEAQDLVPGPSHWGAPSLKYDTRIKPQGYVSYHTGQDGSGVRNKTKGNLYGNTTVVPEYDPLAVKPYSLLTEGEKKLREKKYGKSGFPTEGLTKMPIKTLDAKDLYSSLPVSKVPDLKADTMGSQRYIPFTASANNPNIPKGYWESGMGNREIEYAHGGNLDVNDPRTFDMWGAPLEPTMRKNPSNVDRQMVNALVKGSYDRNLNPFTTLAMGLQETTLGTATDHEGSKMTYNPLHINEPHNAGPMMGKNTLNKSLDFIKEKQQYAKDLGVKGEDNILQLWNGNGPLRLNPDEFGGGNFKVYGRKTSDYPILDVVPNEYTGQLTTRGYDQKKTPVYANSVLNLRDSVIQQNPEIVKIANQYAPSENKRMIGGQSQPMQYPNGGTFKPYGNPNDPYQMSSPNNTFPGSTNSFPSNSRSAVGNNSITPPRMAQGTMDTSGVGTKPGATGADIAGYAGMANTALSMFNTTQNDDYMMGNDPTVSMTKDGVKQIPVAGQFVALGDTGSDMLYQQASKTSGLESQAWAGAAGTVSPSSGWEKKNEMYKSGEIDSTEFGISTLAHFVMPGLDTMYLQGKHNDNVNAGKKVESNLKDNQQFYQNNIGAYDAQMSSAQGKQFGKGGSNPNVWTLMDDSNPLAYGGQMTTEYKTGGTHEQNPNGGIPIGNSLVEEGEIRFDYLENKQPKSYIFSNRLKYKKNGK